MACGQWNRVENLFGHAISFPFTLQQTWWWVVWLCKPCSLLAVAGLRDTNTHRKQASKHQIKMGSKKYGDQEGVSVTTLRIRKRKTVQEKRFHQLVKRKWLPSFRVCLVRHCAARTGVEKTKACRKNGPQLNHPFLEIRLVFHNPFCAG